MDRLDRMIALVRRHVPDLRLRDKRQSGIMRALARAVRPWNPHFQTHYTTVIGATIYLPDSPLSRDALAATLAHELIHQLDQQRWGWRFYLGYALWAPIWRTRRAHWERRAYRVDLLLAAEAGDAALTRRAEQLVPLFAGPAYGWMWGGDRAARDFLAPAVAEVRAGTVQAEEPYRSILAAWRGEA